MDEDAFKQTYRDLNARPCVFAKAILIRCCGCRRSQKVLLAEREAIACLSPGGEQRCRQLLTALRERALFALKLTHLAGPLPHGKEIRVQCGSYLGLRELLGGEPEDLDTLMQAVLERYPTADQLPYGEILRAITHFQPRRRGRD